MTGKICVGLAWIILCAAFIFSEITAPLEIKSTVLLFFCYAILFPGLYILNQGAMSLVLRKVDTTSGIWGFIVISGAVLSSLMGGGVVSRIVNFLRHTSLHIDRDTLTLIILGGIFFVCIVGKMIFITWITGAALMRGKAFPILYKALWRKFYRIRLPKFAHKNKPVVLPSRTEIHKLLQEQKEVYQLKSKMVLWFYLFLLPVCAAALSLYYYHVYYKVSKNPPAVYTALGVLFVASSLILAITTLICWYKLKYGSQGLSLNKCWKSQCLLWPEIEEIHLELQHSSHELSTLHISIFMQMGDVLALPKLIYNRPESQKFCEFLLQLEVPKERYQIDDSAFARLMDHESLVDWLSKYNKIKQNEQKRLQEEEQVFLSSLESGVKIAWPVARNYSILGILLFAAIGYLWL